MPGQTEDKKITILTVDDHPVFRDGLGAMIRLQPDMVIVGEAENGLDAITMFRTLRPDVTLMDLQMPGMSGVGAIREIISKSPTARIVVLTTYTGDVQVLRALNAGAVGYLLKSAVRKELLETIRAVQAGHKRIPPEIVNELAAYAHSDSLTEREISVLRLVSTGNANKQIARALAISEDTVKAHLKNVFIKLGVTDRTHAVTIASRRGIFDL